MSSANIHRNIMFYCGIYFYLSIMLYGFRGPWKSQFDPREGCEECPVYKQSYIHIMRNITAQTAYTVISAKEPVFMPWDWDCISLTERCWKNLTMHLLPSQFRTLDIHQWLASNIVHINVYKLDKRLHYNFYSSTMNQKHTLQLLQFNHEQKG